MTISFEHAKEKKTKRIIKAGNTIENIDAEAMERNRKRLAEALTGIKDTSNIDDSLCEEYDKKVLNDLNTAGNVIMDELKKHPEWLD